MEPNHQNQNHHHYILPTKVAVGVGATLLFLTVVTVWIAGIDLGALNFPVAMAVATVKASLVMSIFMNLRYDRRENAVIFLTSFVFLAIFIVLAGMDLFFRGDVYVKGPLMAAAGSSVSKLKEPWVSTPELIAHGKEIFAVQCVSCHGAEGMGNGPAASACNPTPRNFHVTDGWKNGRKPTMVFKTLKEGLPPSAMASYATLPPDDRWALTHFVLSLGGKAIADAAADFATVGLDPSKPGGGATEAPTISVELAMNLITTPDLPSDQVATLYHPGPGSSGSSAGIGAGAQIYQSKCIQCHAPEGNGGIKVKSLIGKPLAFVTTRPFHAYDAIKSQDEFNQIVIRGMPGELMPGNGQLGSSELSELYQYVRGLSGSL